MNAELFNFMSSHGVSLKDSGSAERGFAQEEMLKLLNLLGEQNIKPLGLEVWHRQGDGRYKIDSLSVWIPEASLDIDILFSEVVNLMSSVSKKGAPVFTIQF
jgi:hypothetical protein